MINKKDIETILDCQNEKNCLVGSLVIVLATNQWRLGLIPSNDKVTTQNR